MDGLPVERLRDYLRQLPPRSQALLIAELERAVLRGDDIPGGDVLLKEVRSVVRASGTGALRVGDPARLFFKAVEPFLIDDDSDRKHLARIARSAIEPLWAWISRDLVPGEAGVYCDEAAGALAANDAAAAERLACDLQDRVARRIEAALAAGKSDDKARRKLAGQIGTPRALDDARDLHTILSSRDAFALIESRLPGQIRNLGDSHLESVKALLDSPVCAKRELLPYVLILVMDRLAAPWQLIRLAVKAAESDDAVRIAASPYAVAVPIILGEIERMVRALKADLKRGVMTGANTLLRSIHDTARGLRTELDLASDTAWARQLAAIRSEISDVLKIEIEAAPGRVRRLLRLRPSSDIARGAVLDASEVAETQALLEFVGACRNYAGELAVNEMTLRTYSDLQHYLEGGTPALLDALRHAGDSDRPFRQSQVDAAVGFCAAVFGREYASLLSKAAEVAVNSAASERKAAAKA